MKNDEGDRVKMQKRLLLANLKEIYASFKKEHDDKLGFSTFLSTKAKMVCNGRQKWNSISLCLHNTPKRLTDVVSDFS